MSPEIRLSLVCTFLLAAEPVDWPALLQKPYRDQPEIDLGLRPVLSTSDGKKITTKDEWEKAREKLRAAWLERLGKSPEKPDPLDVKIEKTEEGDGYTRRLLSFGSEGGDRIRAYLLTPASLKKDEKRPAVVVFHETNRETIDSPAGLGKKPWNGFALHLVQRGYITLCPECFIIKDPAGWASGQAKALAKRQPGWTGMGKLTFDASRCVDFLETRPEVDKDRIACIGHSLGAKEVLYAMAFEPRYKAGIFNEGGIGIRMSNWTDPWYLTDDMKKHVPEFEHHQLLALVAPRPFLIGGGDDGIPDKACVDGEKSWPFIRAALPVYELYGAGDRIGLICHKGRHSFPRDARRTAYRWLDHWMKHTPERDEVGPTVPPPEKR
jgi:dienelactone hydrolase